ncbi:MAG: 3-dehydroquinate synthase [Gracilibacteraceae bacterium]|jgi:3-dehydroquinate synthase|nr:3-dehydroquinate synthase [Gracilibacteraceae bacterium]
MAELMTRLGDRSYPIIIRRGLLAGLGGEIRRLSRGSKIFIVTDENVNAHYGAKVEKSLQQAGYITGSLVLPAGERTKSFANVPVIYDALLDFGLTRRDMLLTLGGGVIGDVGGFAASTYMRGVAYAQIPTSLLAQIDSSIGGKVAVNHPRGKNLIGNFYHPTAVFIDPDALITLPDRFFADGMAEVIKTACVKDARLWRLIGGLMTRAEMRSDMEKIITRCCQIKKEIVEADELDKGERMILNFGHTIGHAAEAVYRYERYTHGEAVAIGMSLITAHSEALEMTAPGTTAALRKVLRAYDLPCGLEEGADGAALVSSISHDKKNIGASLYIVLLKEIGQGFVYETTLPFFHFLLPNGSDI